MNIERELKPVDQQPESPKVEASEKNSSNNTVDSNPVNLKTEQEKRDEAEIAEIRTSFGLEQESEKSEIKQYLKECFNIEKEDVDRIELLEIKNLPECYQPQREFLDDERLDEVTIAVVPDELWIKGNQPSESDVEKQLILIKQSYFETEKNPDEIAWLCHELAHCQNFFDSELPEEYQSNMRKFAFEDLKTEYSYPNNLVEQFAFTKQFNFLKGQGKSREDITTMIGEYYKEEDFPFFNRLLNDIYGK